MTTINQSFHMLTPKGLKEFQQLLDTIKEEADKTTHSLKTNGVALDRIKKPASKKR